MPRALEIKKPVFLRKGGLSQKNSPLRRPLYPERTGSFASPGYPGFAFSMAAISKCKNRLLLSTIHLGMSRKKTFTHSA
jgi:hypothetical protein